MSSIGMILVDTSVWIDHIARTDRLLAELLLARSVLAHPFVLGEISCGNFRSRASTLNFLAKLPVAQSATHQETFDLMENRKLWARGVGWIDLHLLASALITGCQFWTHDLRLQTAASLAGVPLYRRTH